MPLCSTQFLLLLLLVVLIRCRCSGRYQFSLNLFHYFEFIITTTIITVCLINNTVGSVDQSYPYLVKLFYDSRSNKRPDSIRPR